MLFNTTYCVLFRKLEWELLCEQTSGTSSVWRTSWLRDGCLMNYFCLCVWSVVCQCLCLDDLQGGDGSDVWEVRSALARTCLTFLWSMWEEIRGDGQLWFDKLKCELFIVTQVLSRGYLERRFKKIVFCGNLHQTPQIIQRWWRRRSMSGAEDKDARATRENSPVTQSCHSWSYQPIKTFNCI